MKKTVEIENKKAKYEYFIYDTYTAGLQLRGTEIKSIRKRKVSIKEAYCDFIDDELFVKNMNIAIYSHGNIYNHEPKRNRKLLLKKRELKKLNTKFKERGYTIIPTKIFISDYGFAKLEIALAKGKKLYDKRNSIKDKDMKKGSGVDYE
ncbi:MAG: SsrA-binding protein SmpB [Bacteroidota bacterium]|nr:SsrA-binding protein SmpB [Bacteroidota bacterium]